MENCIFKVSLLMTVLTTQSILFLLCFIHECYMYTFCINDEGNPSIFADSIQVTIYRKQ